MQTEKHQDLLADTNCEDSNNNIANNNINLKDCHMEEVTASSDPNLNDLELGITQTHNSGTLSDAIQKYDNFASVVCQNSSVSSTLSRSSSYSGLGQLETMLCSDGVQQSMISFPVAAGLRKESSDFSRSWCKSLNDNQGQNDSDTLNGGNVSLNEMVEISTQGTTHKQSESACLNDICKDVGTSRKIIPKKKFSLETERGNTSSQPNQPVGKSKSGAPMFASLRDIVAFYNDK